MYKALITTFTAILVSACAQTVKVSHTPLSEPYSDELNNNSQLLPTKVLVHALPDSQHKLHVQSGLIIVGMMSDWKIDLHSTLPEAVGELLTQHSNDVKVVKSAKADCLDCGMIVRPKITQVKVNKLTMQSTVALDLDVYDTNSKLVNTISAKGSSSFLSGARLGTITASYYIPFFGNAVGGPLVRETLKSALDKALVNANNSLLAETKDGGSLARSWLPRKREFGKHEYVAERTARDVGCNSRTDGIQLIDKKFSQETYQAMCYGIPRFKIVCEYGRCTPEQNGEHVARSAHEQEKDKTPAKLN